MNKLPLKVKLIIAFLCVGILPALVATGIAWWNGTTLITHELEKSLTSTRDLQKMRFDDLLKEITALTQSNADSSEVKAALVEYRAAFDKIAEQLMKNKKLDAQSISQHVKTHYEKEWGAEYQKIHKTPATELSRFMEYDEKGYAAQYSYVSANPQANKSALETADDGTDYSKVHKYYHKSMENLANSFKMDDAILVDAQSGYILWTARKEMDFGANIKRGALAETVEGRIFKAALADPGKTHISDMERFFPSLDQPAIFASAAIKVNGVVEGVLIFQIPFERIDAITNLDREWKDHGLGETGETYIIGKDKIMRSTARGIIENKDKYIEEIRKSGLDEKTVQWIANTGTSAGMLEIKSDLTDRALEGKEAVEIGKDYRGEEVIVAYKPLAGFRDWFLMIKLDTAEGLAGVNKLKYVLLTLVVVAAGLIFALAWMLGGSLSKSIAAIATRLSSGSEQVAEASQEIAAGATELSESATEQAASLQETSAAVDEISAMVNRSAENAEQSRQRARSSQERIQDGKRAISEMLQAMSSINESNEHIVSQVTNNAREFESVVSIISEIGNRTKVINDIVFQTKLLSFNASVEAARAGEHGKGFAVVAEEVGNLAQMSGNAAKEISGMLEESIKRVTSISNESKRSVEQLIETGKIALTNGNEKARTCDKVFDEIMQDAGAVTGIVEEIATSAREQATGIQEVTKAMGQLDQATQQNTAVAQQSSVAAERLSTQSSDLHQLVISLEAIVHGSGKGEGRVVKQKTRKASKTSSGQKTQASVKSSATQATDDVNVLPLKKKAHSAAPVKANAQATKMAVGSDIGVPSEDDPRFEEV